MLVHFFRPYLFTLLILTISTSVFAEFTTVWQKSLPETGLSGVCVKNGLIFFTVNDIEDAKFSENNNQGKKGIIGLNIKGKCYDLDGNFKWEYQSTVSPLSLRGTSKPVFDKKFIYVGFGNGNLVKIESRTGVVQWEVPVTISEGVSEIERMIDIDAMPVISANGLAYAVSFQGDLSAIEIAQGRIIWRRSTSSINDIIHAKNRTYIVDSKDFINCYDGIRGDTLWSVNDFKLRKLSSPKRFKNHMIVGDFEGYLHAINLNSGEIEGRIKPSNQAIYKIYAINESLYTLDESGKISALKIK